MPARRFAGNYAALYGAGGAAAAFSLDLTTLADQTALGGYSGNGVAIYTYSGSTDALQTRSADTPRGFLKDTLGTRGIIQLGTAGTETQRRIACPLFAGPGNLATLVGLPGGGVANGYGLRPINPAGTLVRIDKLAGGGWSTFGSATAQTVAAGTQYFLEHTYSGGTATLKLYTATGTLISTETDSGGYVLGQYGLINDGTGGSIDNAYGNLITTTGLAA